MEWGRTISKDIVIAHHEAAHAVTAEYLAPGCVMGASVEGYVPGFESVSTMGLTPIGQVIWRENLFPTDFEFGVAVWASRPGEGLVAEHVDPQDHPFEGDDQQFTAFVPPHLRIEAAERAEEIVRGNEPRIRRLAEELLHRRVMSGDHVRHSIGA